MRIHFDIIGSLYTEKLQMDTTVLNSFCEAASLTECYYLHSLLERTVQAGHQRGLYCYVSIEEIGRHES